MRVLIYQAGNHVELVPSIVHAFNSVRPDLDIVVYAAHDSYAVSDYLKLLQLGCRVLASPPLGEAFDLTIIDPLLPANMFNDPAAARERIAVAMDGVRSRNILFGIHIMSGQYLLSAAELTAARRGVLLFGDYLRPPENLDSFCIYPAYFGDVARDPCLHTLSSVAGFRRGSRDHAGTVDALCEFATRRGFTVHLVGKRAQDDLYPEVSRTVAAAGACGVHLHPDMDWCELHKLLAETGFLVSLPTLTPVYSSGRSITGIINLAVGYKLPLLLERSIAKPALDRWLSGSYRSQFHYRDRRDMLDKVDQLDTVSPEAYKRYTAELSAVYSQWMGHNTTTAQNILAWLR